MITDLNGVLVKICSSQRIELFILFYDVLSQSTDIVLCAYHKTFNDKLPSLLFHFRNITDKLIFKAQWFIFVGGIYKYETYYLYRYNRVALCVTDSERRAFIVTYSRVNIRKRSVYYLRKYTRTLWQFIVRWVFRGRLLAKSTEFLILFFFSCFPSSRAGRTNAINNN